jgi:hypothetical protein
VGLDGTDGDYDGGQALPNVTVDRTAAQWLKLQLNASGDPLTYLAHGRIYDDCPAEPVVGAPFKRWLHPNRSAGTHVGPAVSDRDDWSGGVCMASQIIFESEHSLGVGN